MPSLTDNVDDINLDERETASLSWKQYRLNAAVSHLRSTINSTTTFHEEESVCITTAQTLMLYGRITRNLRKLKHLEVSRVKLIHKIAQSATLLDRTNNYSQPTACKSISTTVTHSVSPSTSQRLPKPGSVFVRDYSSSLDNPSHYHHQVGSGSTKTKATAGVTREEEEPVDALLDDYLRANTSDVMDRFWAEFRAHIRRHRRSRARRDSSISDDTRQRNCISGDRNEECKTLYTKLCEEANLATEMVGHYEEVIYPIVTRCILDVSEISDICRACADSLASVSFAHGSRISSTASSSSSFVRSHDHLDRAVANALTKEGSRSEHREQTGETKDARVTFQQASISQEQDGVIAKNVLDALRVRRAADELVYRTLQCEYDTDLNIPIQQQQLKHSVSGVSSRLHRGIRESSCVEDVCNEGVVNHQRGGDDGLNAGTVTSASSKTESALIKLRQDNRDLMRRAAALAEPFCPFDIKLTD